MNMKIVPLSAWLFLIFLAPSMAEEGLEVRQTISGELAGIGTSEIVTKIQGEKIRADLGPTTLLFDTGKGTTTSLIHEQKLFLALPVPTGEQIGAEEPASPFQATGQKRKIAGYDAEEYKGEEQGVQYTVWLSEEILRSQPTLEKLKKINPDDGLTDFFFRTADGKIGFPLRVEINGPEGAMSTEVVSIRNTVFPDSDFSIPDDYRSLEVPKELGDLMKNFQ